MGAMRCTSERDVKKYIKQLLDKHGWVHWMTPANGYGKSGISDHSALRGGVFLAVEAKFGDNKPTPLQVAYLNNVLHQDGFGFVVNEKTLFNFQCWLEAFDRAAEAAARSQEVSPDDGAMMLNAIKAMTEVLA